MTDITDRTRNISSNPEIGNIALGLTRPDAVDTVISILELPDIGAILLDGTPLSQIGQELTHNQLERLVFQPDPTGVGNDQFSYRLTTASGSRSEPEIDLTTLGTTSGTALYFSAERNDVGTELWRLLPGGQVELVANIHAGDEDSHPRFFERLGDELYFRANMDFEVRFSTGYEPWRIGLDGTPELIEEVNPGRPHGGPSEFTAFGSHVYFQGTNVDTGAELYRTGPGMGVDLVADIIPGSDSSRPTALTVYNGVLYFVADTDAHGRELWRYTEDGGTEMVADIYAGTSNSNPANFTVSGGTLYFTASSRGDGNQLWSIDPLGNLQQVTDADDIGANAKPRALYDFADALWFQADLSSSLGNNYDLYRLTSGGTPELVENITVGGLASEIRQMQDFGGALYFGLGESVDGDRLGQELWRVRPDGTLELVADINPGAPASNPGSFTPFGSALYFTATTATHGQELWRVDAGGRAEMVRDLNPGDGAGVSAPYVFEGYMYFAGDDGTTGFELWRMSPDETMELVSDINDGAGTSLPSNFEPLPIQYTVAMPGGSFENDILNGTPLDDISDGGPGNDRLLGFGGNDSLDGGPGADTINGGDGDDQIIGGPGDSDLRDQIFGGAGHDNIDAGAGNDLVFGQDGNDTIAGGAGVDELQGQDGDDVITGSNYSDLVFGGAGNDFVNGGFGHDRINGGSGADRFFHVGVEGHGSDWVQDYVAGDGDVLLWGGGPATASDFQVNLAHTANAAGERSGDDGVQEAFVIYKPSEQILWALVDGAGQDQINIQIGGNVFDLLA
ncbi:hypothetical protein K3727_21510 (plasmid) [Rhodobacteraceae bacterium M382]|nr:hypothetical protein K3727_21510 [Rhodobacteraceae bacterium M382]